MHNWGYLFQKIGTRKYLPGIFFKKETHICCMSPPKGDFSQPIPFEFPTSSVPVLPDVTPWHIRFQAMKICWFLPYQTAIHHLRSWCFLWVHQQMAQATQSQNELAGTPESHPKKLYQHRTQTVKTIPVRKSSLKNWQFCNLKIYSLGTSSRLTRTSDLFKMPLFFSTGRFV